MESIKLLQHTAGEEGLEVHEVQLFTYFPYSFYTTQALLLIMEQQEGSRDELFAHTWPAPLSLRNAAGIVQLSRLNSSSCGGR